MKKASLRMLLGLVLALGVSAAAFAEEGGEAKGKQRRRKPAQRNARRNVKRRRPRPGPQHRMMMQQRLRNTEEGKAEIARFKTAMKAHHEAGKKIHEAIRKEIKDGGEPKAVFAAHAAELKAQMKKGILLNIEHREKMLAVAKKNVDKFVEEAAKKMQERGQRAKNGKRQVEGADKDGANDVDGEDEEDRPRRRPNRRPPQRRRPRPDDDDDDEE